jgi:Family of unknown function (DUF6165)
MPNHGQALLAPVSIGELIDKITILEIKAERIADPGKLRNVATELAGLRAIRSQAGLDAPDMEPHARELRALNTALWEIEDQIRELEAKQDFGTRFVNLARSVYQTNDKRAAVKNRINQAFGSAIVEEKSYKGG